MAEASSTIPIPQTVCYCLIRHRFARPGTYLQILPGRATGSVNYRRKTVCACCAWRPQGIATTILRLRRAIHSAIRSGDRKVCHDNSQAWDERSDVHPAYGSDRACPYHANPPLSNSSTPIMLTYFYYTHISPSYSLAPIIFTSPTRSMQKSYTQTSHPHPSCTHSPLDVYLHQPNLHSNTNT